MWSEILKGLIWSITTGLVWGFAIIGLAYLLGGLTAPDHTTTIKKQDRIYHQCPEGN